MRTVRTLSMAHPCGWSGIPARLRLRVRNSFARPLSRKSIFVKEKIMKVAYLYTSYRGEVAQKVRQGEDHGNGFWGMFKLPHYGIESTYLAPELFYP